MTSITENFNTKEIEIHIRTYRSLLKSTGKVQISQLIESHKRMNSILHSKGNKNQIDSAAFIYVLLRLPNIMSDIKTIVLGQSFDVFNKHGFSNIDDWEEVSAPGRRRKMYYDGKSTLAVYIASVTDVDDIITLLTCFQIEWNKCHQIWHGKKQDEIDANKMKSKDIERLKNIFGEEYNSFIQKVSTKPVDLTVSLLSGSYVEYAKATQSWWEKIATALIQKGLDKNPIYFVSSNTHSIKNLLIGLTEKEEKKLISYLYKLQDALLIKIWRKIEKDKSAFHKENFLFYIAKKYQKINNKFKQQRDLKSKKAGIIEIKASHYLDIDVQIIQLAKLTKTKLINQALPKKLKKSQAIIINIDYPLGWAAYQILTEIGQNVPNVRGVYVMGKAATLNGQIGDILIPDSVYDQHTKNIYAFDNSFSEKDFRNIFQSGTILEGQKTIAVKGTFLQNSETIKNWYSENFSIVEMETGPFLNACYEFVYYNRYVENQFINLTKTPFEIGFAHYASDTPYSKAKNLGVRNLSYEGVEPTYAISLAIIQKIIKRERKLYLA